MGRVARTAIVFLAVLAVSRAYADTNTFRLDWKKNEIAVRSVARISSQETGNRIEWQHSAAVHANNLVLENFFASLGALRVDAATSFPATVCPRTSPNAS